MAQPTSKSSRPPANRLITRPYPPITSCDTREWVRRTQTGTYRRRVKRAIQMVQGYLLSTKGSAHVSRAQRDAVHYLLDTNVPDNDRRMRDNRGAAPTERTELVPGASAT